MSLAEIKALLAKERSWTPEQVEQLSIRQINELASPTDGESIKPSGPVMSHKQACEFIRKRRADKNSASQR